MLGAVGREVFTLPEGWDQSITDQMWPQAMISAVRQDVGALGSPRVIQTLRTWQHQALDEADPSLRQEARSRLEALGRALRGEPDTDELLAVFDLTLPPPAPPQEPEDGTVDAFRLPPKPRLRREAPRPVVSEVQQRPRILSTPKARRVSLPPTEEDDTDARVLAQKPNTGASAPPESGFEEENPTTAFMFVEDRVGPPPPPPPPLPVEVETLLPERGPTPRVRIPSHALKAPVVGAPFMFEEDDKPTRHIALPEEILMRRVDSAQAALVDAEPERTQMAPYPQKPPAPPPRGVTPKIQVLESARSIAEGQRLAPKPGVIRRSSHSHRGSSAPRPRAAMHHVRALQGLLSNFVEELVPLSYERRSRRFWARWREVAGDRGVRRDFVEELLRTATDSRTLLCELIAEMQSADPKSVYQLIDKLGDDTPAIPAEPVPDGSRPHVQLMGASVRVEPEDS